VSVEDIAPTILALGGASADGVDGAPLDGITPGARPDAPAPPRPVFVRTARRAAVIDGNLKLVVMERKKRDRLFLFDLAEDPGETRDLSEARRDDLERLHQKLSAWESSER
jgi:arylsulfatase A-like enzyme